MSSTAEQGDSERLLWPRLSRHNTEHSEVIGRNYCRTEAEKTVVVANDQGLYFSKSRALPELKFIKSILNVAIRSSTFSPIREQLRINPLPTLHPLPGR